MGVKSETVKITTTGGAGVATGSVTTEATIGELLGINLNFHASAPATTDTTITAATHGFTILTVANSVTDAYKGVAVSLVDTANAAIASSHRPLAVHDRVTIALAQSDALTDALVATVFWRD